MSDKDLDVLLADLRAEKASDPQIQKWKKAVHGARPSRASAKKIWWQLAAAGLAGFLIGAMLVRSLQPNPLFSEIAQNSSDDATFEYIITKTN